MNDREYTLVVEARKGDDKITVNMKKKLTESDADFNERVMKELGHIFPFMKLVYKARNYHE